MTDTVTIPAKEYAELLARIDELEELLAEHERPLRHGQNRETDERNVEGALRTRFNEEWRKHFKGEEPRSWQAQRGDAIEICRQLLTRNANDVHRAINEARVLAANLFLPRFLWRDRPLSWRAVNRDVGQFFMGASATPSLDKRVAAQAARDAARWKRDEAEAVPPPADFLAALKANT